jgi:hypothetical protein
LITGAAHQLAGTRNFFGAARRAFLADGREANWTLWRRHFPTFEPILDFIHARRTKANNWSTRQVSDARPWEPERGRLVLQAGRMISPGWGGAMVTDHLGKLGSRTSRPSNILLSALLRRTPLLYVALMRSTCGCLPA